VISSIFRAGYSRLAASLGRLNAFFVHYQCTQTQAPSMTTGQSVAIALSTTTYDVCRYHPLEKTRSTDADGLELSSTNAHQTTYGTSAKGVGFIEDNPARVIATYSTIDEWLCPPNLDTLEEGRRCRCRSSGLPNLAFVRLVGSKQLRNICVQVMGVFCADEAEEYVTINIRVALYSRPATCKHISFQ